MLEVSSHESIPTTKENISLFFMLDMGQTAICILSDKFIIVCGFMNSDMVIFY